MLNNDRDWLLQISEADQAIYDSVLPQDALLLAVLQEIGWDTFVPKLQGHYCPNLGQPAIAPLILLKLEFLRYF